MQDRRLARLRSRLYIRGATNDHSRHRQRSHQSAEHIAHALRGKLAVVIRLRLCLHLFHRRGREQCLRTRDECQRQAVPAIVETRILWSPASSGTRSSGPDSSARLTRLTFIWKTCATVVAAAIPSNAPGTSFSFAGRNFSHSSITAIVTSPTSAAASSLLPFSGNRPPKMAPHIAAMFAGPLCFGERSRTTWNCWITISTPIPASIP